MQKVHRAAMVRLACSPVWLLAPLLWSCGIGTEVFQLVGTVERKTLELAAPISEVIVDIPVRVGERVAEGQVVVRMDTEVAEAELKAFEAAHAAAQATLEQAEREFTRIDGLRKARVSTPREFDQARRARDEAVALVAEKEARIAQANKRLRDLTILSYAAGVVDQLPFEAGERVPAGGVVAVVLADERPWVRVWLPARAVARMGDDVQAEVRVEGHDEKFRGSVGDVAREPEFTPHYALTERESAHLVFEARILLEEDARDLRPGLPARVRLFVPKRRKSA